MKHLFTGPVLSSQHHVFDEVHIFPIIGVKKEGNVLFNDALNTFFIYGYMVKDIW